jgi:predicted enzyme related to lactoylglutathione lyase
MASERQRVTGIGGVFFRTGDPAALAAWYAEHLGLAIEPGNSAIVPDEAGSYTVWAAFPDDTDYFGESGQPLMINYRVADLDAMLAQLRADGVRVADKVEDTPYGRFSWAYDPAGNRFELWQP